MRSLKLPGMALRSRIILSMAGMVFITAIACLVTCVLVIDSRTQDFTTRLQTMQREIPTPPPADEVVNKLKTILASDAAPNVQVAQVRQLMRANDVASFDKIQQALNDSGWPVPLRNNPPPPLGAVVDGKQAQPANPDTTPAVGEPAPPPGVGDRYKIIKTFNSEERGLAQAFATPIYNSIIIGSLISAVFAVALGFILTYTVIKPLRKLEQASERIADGNYMLEIKPEGRDDLGRLAASFNKMTRVLRQTEQKRKDLVADVSHELRTPLSSIQGYTEALRDGLIQSQTRTNEIYDHILKEVKHLTTMVNSLRGWVNNEQSLEHLSRETFGVRSAVDSVLARFGPLAGNKIVTLKTDIASPEPEVWADAEAFSHILSNLVDNALRYTPPEGTITVRVNPANKQRFVWFDVIDTGTGIPAEHLPFVFERFYRVDKSRDSETGGSGLGLAIVRDTVLALGGDVKISSTVGEGTIVSFSLPIPEKQKKEAKNSRTQLVRVG